MKVRGQEAAIVSEWKVDVRKRWTKEAPSVSGQIFMYRRDRFCTPNEYHRIIIGDKQRGSGKPASGIPIDSHDPMFMSPCILNLMPGEWYGPFSAACGVPILSWGQGPNDDSWREDTIGDFAAGDGVRFSHSVYPTCHRRGIHRLLIEVAEGDGHDLWGCFDDADQPMRWYHNENCMLCEAELIAEVLLRGRKEHGKQS